MAMVVKAWRRYTTLPKQTSSKGCTAPRSWTSDGCFSVYVGPEKQRFVVKAEFANHPAFKVLLEDAALEYGYQSDGPILLPCDVDLFYQVLAEIDNIDEDIIGSNWPLIPIFFVKSIVLTIIGSLVVSTSPMMNQF